MLSEKETEANNAVKEALKAVQRVLVQILDEGAQTEPNAP